MDRLAGARLDGTYELMWRAALALANCAEDYADDCGCDSFLVLAGHGNNGGDALLTARNLAMRGHEVHMHLVTSRDRLRGDALKAWQEIQDDLHDYHNFFFFEESIPSPEVLQTPHLLVLDGLLGTGINGVPQEPYASWIRLLQDCRQPIMSLDIPSGLNADTGEAELSVTADLTATLAAPKAGMFLRQGPEQCGRLRVLDIGIPADIRDTQPVWQAEDGLSPEGFSFAEAAALLSREPFTTYKNQRGHLLVVGGSREYSGAPLLTAEAALRAGSGLVTLALPESCNPLATLPRSVMVRKFSTVNDLLPLAEGKSALAIGPGLGLSDFAAEVVAELLRLDIPTALDADGLNLLAKNPQWLESHRQALLLTPHSGEYRRLVQGFLGESSAPNDFSCDLAKATGATVLLKGCRSQISAPDGRLSLNLSGAPSLATAGSGDVLTGICGAFLANGLPPYDAARLACFLHGLAGELAAPCGSRGAIADDLPGLLPEVFRRFFPRN